MRHGFGQAADRPALARGKYYGQIKSRVGPTSNCEKKVNPTSDLGRAVSSTLQYSWPCAATSGLAPLIVNGLIGAASFLGLAPLWVIAASLPADHKKEVKAKSIIQALS